MRMMVARLFNGALLRKRLEPTAIATIAGFNNGSVDIGLGNRSASTGYSMHSSSKFENQNRRHFLIAQPERDINVFKQFLGRFHRTGQVNAPKISLIVGDTPDEKRPAAVLAKKLTTLNANTTAAVKGGVDFEGIPDYFNEIGNQIVTDIMRDDPDLSDRLFNPISVSEYATEAVQNAAAKVTGCLPILPVAEQEEFYQQLDMEYQATLDRYKAMGENPLEATGVNLDARTLASVEVVAEAVGVDSAFARGITAEVVDVLVQSKPKTQLEVINDVRQTLEMKPVRVMEDHDQGAANIASTELVNQLYQQTEQITDRYLAEKKLQYAQQEPDAEKLQGKIDRLEERCDKQLAALSRIKRFRPGQSVRMAANNGRVFYGVVSNVRKRGKALNTFGDPSVPVKENVAIPSRWEVVIAIADEQRQIALPLSKLNPAVETPDSFTVTPAKAYSKKVDIYELFDKRQIGDREVRTILKGNLLRAADTPYQDQGKLILASMSNGQMEPVMLMEKGFNPQQEMEAAPVILPNAQKVEAFIAATDGRGIVKTTDEAITLKRNQAGEFFIQTGKTRKDVYLDSNLLAAVGGEFTSVSDRMQVKFEQGRLEDVVSYLMKGKGKRLAAFTEQSAARELLGLTIPELKWADTVESVVGREGLPPVVDVSNLSALRQQLDNTFAASIDEQADSVSEYATEAVQNAAAKVTGCLPILPVAEQEEFYQQLDMEYQATLDRYKAMGENPLEATGVNLDARTLASVEVVAEAVGVDSAFARGITAEVVDVLVQSKPKTQLEVINDVRQTLEMKPVRVMEDHDQGAANIASTELVNQLYQQTEQITDRYLTEKKLQYAQQEPDAEKLQGKIDRLEERCDKQLAALSRSNVSGLGSRYGWRQIMGGCSMA